MVNDSFSPVGGKKHSPSKVEAVDLVVDLRYALHRSAASR